MDSNCNYKTVITGMGMVTPLGSNLDETWENLLQGKSGVKEISLFDATGNDTKIAAEVNSEFEGLAKELIPKRYLKQMTRTTRMGMVAAEQAIKDSGINFDNYDRTRIAVIMGVITTSYNDNERSKSSSSIIVKSMPNAPSAWISLIHGLEGPNFNVSSACASSAYAIGLGNQMIKSGLIDVAIVGGVDSSIDPEHIQGFNQIMALSVKNDSPEKASCPFSLSRDGFVMGEGAGVIIIESEKVARERNATIYGEVCGYSITSEASGITAPKKDGVGMAKTMKMALDNANIKCGEVDYINAHGTSTYLNDKYETFAIKECFGERAKKIAISSSKSMLGHSLGAAGAIESIITILSIYNGKITPTINYDNPDPELDLDYTPNEAREKDICVAISNSFGFGGHNATLVYKKYEVS